jgi:hypothetical protein
MRGARASGLRSGRRWDDTCTSPPVSRLDRPYECFDLDLYQPEPHGATERRLREGYKVVRMLVDAYDDKTARAWLFGTNTRLDDRAPIEVLGAAIDTAEFAMVARAARQVASFQS